MTTQAPINGEAGRGAKADAGSALLIENPAEKPAEEPRYDWMMLACAAVIVVAAGVMSLAVIALLRW